MNHVIVEGPDGSGKSHLIEELKLPRVHTLAVRPEDGDAMAFYQMKLTTQPIASGFDRLWLSELIYGPMLREQSAVTHQQAHLLKRMFPEVPVIVCLPPFSVTLHFTRARPWPAFQTDRFLEDAYRAFARYADSDLVDFVYDWSQRNGLRRSLGLPLGLQALMHE